MEPPWDKNTKGDEDYRAWLLKAMAPEEYNELNPVARRTLRTQFEQQQGGITIVNAANEKLWTLQSLKERTVEQLLNTIGDGTLTDSDGYLMFKDDILKAGTYTFKPEEAGNSTNEPAEDTAKQLSGFIEQERYDAAWELMTSIVAHYREGLDEESDHTKCSPVKIESTWEGDMDGPENLTNMLEAQCKKIETNIKAQVRVETLRKNGQEPTMAECFEADNRKPLVIAIRLGTGCGKTHLLLEAPKLLKRPGIYITYNLNQSLIVDRDYPRHTILIRILLRMAGLPHAGCWGFLSSFVCKTLVQVRHQNLLGFTAHQLGKYSGEGVIIGVDEIMRLKENSYDPVKEVVSELGLVAKEYNKMTGGLCNVFVTSLKGGPFTTSSGTAVLRWTPQPPDENAAELILRSYFTANAIQPNRDMRKLFAVLIASAGFHFRSLVFAAEVLGKNLNSTVQYVFAEVYERWAERVDGNQIEAIQDFIVAECKGTRVAKENVEIFLDHRQAVPPALICGAFEVMTKGNNDSRYTVNDEHPLYNLFNCEWAFKSDAKHLETFGESYDLFRANLKLPVFSARVEIYIKSGRDRMETWYKDLMYPRNLTIAADSLFEMVNNKEVRLSEAGKSPSMEKYYSPKNKSHPYVDRAFLAVHPTHGNCFILIQDTVNSDVPTAVAKLNKAGALLKQQHSNLEILCVLNIVGAGPNTTSQKNLDYPHVLVRDSELDTFYTAHFAPVARFIRARHEIGEQMRKQREGKAEPNGDNSAPAIGPD